MPEERYGAERHGNGARHEQEFVYCTSATLPSGPRAQLRLSKLRGALRWYVEEGLQGGEPFERNRVASAVSWK